MDQQSLQGKAPLAAASLAAARGIPVVAVAGQLSLTKRDMAAAGICSAASLIDIAPSVDAAKGKAARYAELATAEAIRRLNRDPTTADDEGGAHPSLIPAPNVTGDPSAGRGATVMVLRGDAP